MVLPKDLNVRNNLRPGDVGYITYLHGKLYSEDKGWDHTFDSYVAIPLSEFSKSSSEREKIWILEIDSRIVGSIAIVEASDDKAQLRWFLLHPDIRGHGIGKQMVNEAISFSREKGYTSIFLWTVRSLPVAAHIYKSAGFRITVEKMHKLWGNLVTEQRYDLNFT